MDAGTWWIVFGLLACGAEMLVPGLFLLPVGLAAILTGVAVWLGIGLTGAWLVFVGGIGVAMAVTVIWRRSRTQPDDVNGPAAGLIGAICIAGVFDGAEGRVSLGDGAWPARLTGPFTQPAPPAGTRLRVVGVDGTTLVVADAQF